MTQEANWTIRVGGVYRFADTERADLVTRVTAIEGDVVYSVHVWLDTKREFGNRKDDPEIFRALRMPENVSPIPKLLAALESLVNFREGLVWDVENPPDGEDLRHFVIKRDDLWMEAKEALEAAK
jgi:hypothetical protein